MPATDVVELHAVVDERLKQVFVGRFAWTLNELVVAGERGCTPIDQPAPRWSHYVFRLRRDGVSIETIDEKHGGTFSGHHARYVLRSKVEVVKVVRAGEKRHAA